jgi:hypothetical protein
MITRIAFRALPALILVLVLVVPVRFLPAVIGMPVEAANTLTLTPNAGTPYTPITIAVDAGTFTAGTPVTAGFRDAAGNPSQPLATGAAAVDGSATLSGVIPFSAAVGNASITVTGTLTNNPVSLHGVFLVRPVIQLTPDHAAAGTTVSVTVYGNGFDPNSHVTFSENGVPLAGSSAQTGPDGSFPSLSISLVVPTTGTALLIGASDATGAQAQAAFTIDAGQATIGTSTPTPIGVSTGTGLTINPAAGPPGIGNVAVSSAAGAFSGLSSVALKFTDHAGNALTLPPAPVSATGAVSASITLPVQAAGGAAVISAQATGFAPLSGQFRINPTLSFSPTVVPPGGTFSVTGDGFTPQATVNFTIGGITASSTVPIVVSTTGHFAMSFTLPTTVPLGPSTLAASDSAGVGPVQAAFTVGTPLPTATVTPIPSPTPGVPTGAAGTTNVYFAEGYTGQAATNKSASFSETLTMLNPLSTPASVTITYFSQDGSPPVVVTRTVPPTSSFNDSVNADVGPDRIVGAEVTSTQRIFVTRTIDRTSPSGARLDGSTSLPTTAPALAWGFPEGYTGITFQEYLTILNPSTVPATVTVTLAPQANSAQGARVSTISVPAQSRRTVNIRALNQGDPAQSVGMLVSSTAPIVAERVEYFGDGAGSGKFGSTVSPGLATPAAQLRFPVLSSGGSAPNPFGVNQPVGDQAYITILNPAPSGSPVQVAAAFANASGVALGQAVTVDVPPGTRRTITVNTSVGASPVGPISAVLNASGPIEAEAAQYVGGSPNTGPHPGVAFVGASSTTTDAFLTNLATTQANGTQVNRSLFISNPSASPEQITATYFGANSAVANSTYTVGAGDILTININQDTQTLGPSAALGAELHMTTGAPGGFLAGAAGLTVDGLAATEDAGSPN